MSIKQRKAEITNAVQQSRGDVGVSPETTPQGYNDVAKYRAFAVILYEDCAEHMEMIKYIKTRNYFEYAIIKHDRDYWTPDDEEVIKGEHIAGEPKKIHYHLMWRVKTPHTLKSQYNYFGVWVKKIVAVNSQDSYIRYMIHDTPSSLHKAQYDFYEVEGTARLINSALSNESIRQNQNLSELCDVLRANGGDLVAVVNHIASYGEYKADELIDTLARFQGLLSQVSRREEKIYERNSAESKHRRECEKYFYEKMTEIIVQNHYSDAKHKVNKGEF